MTDRQTDIRKYYIKNCKTNTLTNIVVNENFLEAMSVYIVTYKKFCINFCSCASSSHLLITPMCCTENSTKYINRTVQTKQDIPHKSLSIGKKLDNYHDQQIHQHTHIFSGDTWWCPMILTHVKSAPYCIKRAILNQTFFLIFGVPSSVLTPPYVPKTLCLWCLTPLQN